MNFSIVCMFCIVGVWTDEAHRFHIFLFNFSFVRATWLSEKFNDYIFSVFVKFELQVRMVMYKISSKIWIHERCNMVP